MTQINKYTSTPPHYRYGLKSKTIIGILSPCYGYERVTYSLNPAPYSYVRVPVIPLHKFFKRKTSFIQYTPFITGRVSPASLLHTWNAIPRSKSPFVVSFECELPRYLGHVTKSQTEFGFNVLATNRCKKVLALSDAAAAKFKRACREQGHASIANKITVFRGGVRLPTAPKNEYSRHGTLRLIFVGTSAFRKGLAPLLNACERLISEGYEISLTVIGAIGDKCYVYREHMPDREVYEKYLSSTSWINYLGRQPPSKVFDSIKEHDLMLFPTFDESLGWIPIEAALLGVPSVTTDIFALPEIIEHQSTGYLVPIEKGLDNRFKGLYQEGDELLKSLQATERQIETGLVDAIKQVYEDRGVIEKWGRAAFEKISILYDTERASHQLSKIYEQSLN